MQNSSLVPRYGIALTWMPTRINDKESGSGNGLVPSGNDRRNELNESVLTDESSLASPEL